MEAAVMTPSARPRGRRNKKESYESLLGRLSHQSVVKHFDAYADIDWDAPDFQLDSEDPRWVRTERDPLGATDWYQSLPTATRARIGLHSACAHMKIGIEFESVLQRGLLEFANTIDGGSPEFRYAYHEVIEEAQHSLMFQEFINRSGLPVRGLDSRTALAARQVVAFGRNFPELFFFFVLGGEEPIDTVQRDVLKNAENLHPLIKRIMQIHVTEEARHLCFAKEYLRKNVPALRPFKMTQLRMAVPVVLGVMAKLMMQPPTSLLAQYGCPAEVIDEAYTNNPAHREKTLESVASVRKLCDELDVISPASAVIWKRYGIYEAA